MIDLHTHILPYMDDGAADVEEALRMADSLHRQDIDLAVCTPHFYPSQISIQEFDARRSKSMKLISDCAVTLLAASETMLDEYLFYYSDLSALCIENTKYLLLELPYDKKWDESIYKMIEKLMDYFDIIPIIAHIERYEAVKKDSRCIKRLIQMGCLIQMNYTSLLNKSRAGLSMKYLKNHYIDVLGSDCHNMRNRPPLISNAALVISQTIGEGYFKTLQDNAAIIVSGNNLRDEKGFVPIDWESNRSILKRKESD